MPATHSEIFKRISIHDPSIVGNFAILLIIQLPEVPFNKRLFNSDLVLSLFQFLISDFTLEAFHGTFDPSLNLACPLTVMSLYYTVNHFACIILVLFADNKSQSSSLCNVKPCLVPLTTTILYEIFVNNSVRIFCEVLQPFKFLLEEIND